jgi:heme-degrading monooxygenase HmoA
VKRILQQSTELLIATLAQTLPGKEATALARVQTIIDTLRSAPGLTTTHFYRGHGDTALFFILTTWEDEESWLKAQERHNPKHLLLNSRELLATPPEQWVLSYIWGFRRPIAAPTLASAHLVAVTTPHIEQARQNWLQELRHPDVQALLTFGFLAQGISDTPTATRIARPGFALNGREIFKQAGSLLMSFYSWSTEIERNAFYASPRVQQLKPIEEKAIKTRIIPLETL